MNYRDNMLRYGSFEIGGNIRVTDPCYEPNIWCAGTLDAAPGNWETGIITVQGTVAVLAARHECCAFPLETRTVNCGADAGKQGENGWTLPTFKVCVDSGQAGLFDAEKYEACNARSDERWYRKVCDMTFSDAMGGVVDGGVVSRAGYGDGGYICVYHKNEDELADFIFLMFMDDAGNEDW